MKRLLLGIFLLCVVMFLFPLLVIPLSGMGEEKEVLPVAAPVMSGGDAVTSGNFPDPYRITLYQTTTGQILNLDFEEYITEIVAAELTPEFSMESIKAQAVAARSFFLSKIATYLENGIPENHHGALLCSDFSHCRSYTPIEEGKDTEYLEKVKKAIESTRGEYLTYKNRVVKAYFHKISSGKTENIRDVWGVEIPYLVSVESKWDSRADGYKSRVFFPKEAFLTVIRGIRPDIKLPEELVGGPETMKCTAAGNVESMTLFGENFSGKEIAEGFGLRSRTFSLEIQDDQAIFDVTGNGHGVGMSQAGARFMAEDGKGYQEILSHYYPGVSLTQLYQKP